MAKDHKWPNSLDELFNLSKNEIRDIPLESLKQFFNPEGNNADEFYEWLLTNAYGEFDETENIRTHIASILKSDKLDRNIKSRILQEFNKTLADDSVSDQVKKRIMSDLSSLAPNESLWPEIKKTLEVLINNIKTSENEDTRNQNIECLISISLSKNEHNITMFARKEITDLFIEAGKSNYPKITLANLKDFIIKPNPNYEQINVYINQNITLDGPLFLRYSNISHFLEILKTASTIDTQDAKKFTKSLVEKCLAYLKSDSNRIYNFGPQILKALTEINLASQDRPYTQDLIDIAQSFIDKTSPKALEKFEINPSNLHTARDSLVVTGIQTLLQCKLNPTQKDRLLDSIKRTETLLIIDQLTKICLDLGSLKLLSDIFSSDMVMDNTLRNKENLKLQPKEFHALWSDDQIQKEKAQKQHALFSLVDIINSNNQHLRKEATTMLQDLIIQNKLKSVPDDLVIGLLIRTCNYLNSPKILSDIVLSTQADEKPLALQSLINIIHNNENLREKASNILFDLISTDKIKMNQYTADILSNPFLLRVVKPDLKKLLVSKTTPFFDKPAPAQSSVASSRSHTSTEFHDTLRFWQEHEATRQAKSKTRNAKNGPSQ